ncbi:hypothetical protein [Singulisphaera sp. GP187]|uniref:hypothetical protein n=1 Tax=Singulisphaera sp. GP187 TaxID=1882752 RepID=UPI0009414CA9|nr:hypothetical protein [Singulisphaera sp. GP187]
MEPTEPTTTVRCPTCRLTQERSDTCRRCKSDLRLLNEAAESARRTRRRCLKALRAGHRREALRLAGHYHWLHPTADSRRLMALTALLSGDWANALALAHDLPELD